MIVETAEKDPDRFGKLLENMENKKTNVDYAAKQVKKAKRHETTNIPKLPKEKFDVILADSPWNYDINTRGSPDEHYLVIEDSEIKELDIPSAENACCFCGPQHPNFRKRWRQ